MLTKQTKILENYRVLITTTNVPEINEPNRTLRKLAGSYNKNYTLFSADEANQKRGVGGGAALSRDS